MRILLIEDDAATAAFMEAMFKREQWVVDVTDSGEDGLEIGKLYDYDIIVLDLMLPDIDGYEVLRRLRAARVRTPVLICSGLGELDHKLKALGFGADDYVTKPFDRRELIARVHAIVRRSKGHAASTIRTGKLVVNLDSRVVEVDEQPLHLTGKEYGILELLSLRKGTTMTKEMFLNHLYGGIDEPELKIIDVFVCKLRKKISKAAGGECYIETIWGRGYVLKDPVTIQKTLSDQTGVQPQEPPSVNQVQGGEALWKVRQRFNRVEQELGSTKEALVKQRGALIAATKRLGSVSMQLQSAEQTIVERNAALAAAQRQLREAEKGQRHAERSLVEHDAALAEAQGRVQELEARLAEADTAAKQGPIPGTFEDGLMGVFSLVNGRTLREVHDTVDRVLVAEVYRTSRGNVPLAMARLGLDFEVYSRKIKKYGLKGDRGIAARTPNRRSS